MGFNPEKQCLKIKELLKADGFVKNIPFDKFGVMTMRVIGSSTTARARKWIINFETMGFITIDNDLINFKEE